MTPKVNITQAAQRISVSVNGAGEVNVAVTPPPDVVVQVSQGAVSVTYVGGDVFGPASSTDNAIARFNGTTGKQIQNSTVTIDDDGDVAGVNSILFDTTPTGSLASQGQVMWNNTEETLDIQLNGFALHTGQHTVYHVKNQTGSAINKGVPVMFAGTDGNSGKLLIQPWNGTGPSNYFMGITAEQLSDGEEGFVIAFGKIRGIQTNGGNYGQTWVNGDIIYAGTTTGSLTNVAPAAPNPRITVAAVVSAHASNGTLFIRPTLGSNIKDDEGVTITSLASGQILVANAAGTIFENKSVSGDATLANTGALTLANTAVTPGSYTLANVTVDSKGRVTAASNGNAVQDGDTLAIGLTFPLDGLNIATDDVGVMRINYNGGEASNISLSFNLAGSGRTIDLLGDLSVEGSTSIDGIFRGRLLQGSGNPEGVVTAPVGSLYTRTDGTPGNTLYVKESGTGNNGWAAK